MIVAIGSFDLAAIALFRAMGIDNAHARLAALGPRAFWHYPPTVNGLGKFWVEGVNLADVPRRGADTRRASESTAGLAPALETTQPSW